MGAQKILPIEPCARQDSHDSHNWMPGYGLDMEYRLCPGKSDLGWMALPEQHCSSKSAHDAHGYKQSNGEYRLCPGSAVDQAADPPESTGLEAPLRHKTCRKTKDHLWHVWADASSAWSCAGRVTQVERKVTVGCEGFRSYSETLERLLRVAEQALTRFAAKNMEYQGTHLDLQPHADRAQFIDINRKVLKLRQAIWEGVDTSDWSEQPREIVEDLMGHCLLLLDIMELNKEQP